MDNANNGNTDHMLVLDLGKMSKKKIKRLRRGEGATLTRLDAALEKFKANGTLDPSAQIVVAVVKQKNKRKSFFSR